MEAKRLPAAHGWLWVKQGIALFQKSAVLWVVLSAIGMIGLMVLSAIPEVGEPLSTLLFPVLYGGLLLGAKALEQGEELELAHLFAGFQRNTQQLVTLGGITLVVQLLILGMMKLTGGSTLADILLSGKPVEDPAVLAQALEAAGGSLFVALLLFTALLLATQFAPMLVLFENMAPVAAMKTSMRFCLRNMPALSLYGVIMLSFAILASIPMMLGWFVLLPLMFTSIYAAYNDIADVPAPPSESMGEPPENAPEA